LKIVATSDTHTHHEKLTIPECDILIHAGDMSFRGDSKELSSFFEWFGDQTQARHRICIAGNHDSMFEYNLSMAQSLVPNNVHYLQDSQVNIDGLLIYGSPWVSLYGNWSFMLPRGGTKLKQKWANIPENTDVLITHGPPKAVLDKAHGDTLGCAHLLHRVHQIKPKVHIFGHIHEGYGQTIRNGTHFVNAAFCDINYEKFRNPITIKI